MSEYNMSDLVWGKMKGYPPWPGIISEPPLDMKKSGRAGSSTHCIYFFGSNNYSWLEEKFLQPYEKYKIPLSKSNKTAAFIEACKAIETYIESGQDKLPSEILEEKLSAQKKSKREKRSKDSEMSDESDTPSIKKSKVNKSLNSVEINNRTPTTNFSTNEFQKRKHKKISAGRESTLKVGTNYDFSDRRNPHIRLINRPNLKEPVISVTDVSDVPQSLKDKNIIPSSSLIGFLGLGIMGSRVAKNIYNSGHKVMIWNRTPDKCDQFVTAGAEIGLTPADVVQRSDITFSCVSDPQAAKELVFGNCGVLSEMTDGKGYVELTSIDSETSLKISESIMQKGGRYLEAQMLGSMEEAEQGNLIFLCAGDETLFDDCQTCFRSCSEHPPYYLGPTGTATNMNLVFQIINGISLSGLVEGLSLAGLLNLPMKTVAQVLEMSPICCGLFKDKMKMIIDLDFPTSQPLRHHQKDLKMALALGEQVGLPMPLTSTINEIFKHACRLGLGAHDSTSVALRPHY